jgi:hypothetical protein
MTIGQGRQEIWKQIPFGKTLAFLPHFPLKILGLYQQSIELRGQLNSQPIRYFIGIGRKDRHDL